MSKLFYFAAGFCLFSSLQAEEAVTYSPKTGKLSIPKIEIRNEFGDITTYQATLSFKEKNQFNLTQLTKIKEQKVSLTPIQSSTKEANCIPFKAPKKLNYLRTSFNSKGLVCDGLGGEIDLTTGTINRCRATGKYQAFKLNESNFDFWINFEPNIIGNYSEKTLKSNFRWLWYQFVIYQDNNTNPFVTERIYIDDLTQLDYFEYKEGHLKWQIKQHLTEISRWVTPVSSACFDNDVGATCRCQYPLDIPYTVSIDLKLPQ